MIVNIVFVILAVLVALFYISTRKFNYWKKRNVPYLKPKLILGNYGDHFLLRKSLSKVGQDICKQFPKEPYIGVFYGTEPALIVQDPEFIKLITTKDFYYFNGREVSDFVHKEAFTQNIFNTYGDDWKVVRQNLTPVFSSAKMKMMFPLIQTCSHAFEKLLDEETSMSDVIEIRTLMARFTMACINSCAFGVDSQTMKGDYKTNPFTQAGNKILDLTSKRVFYRNLVRSIWPTIFYGSRRTFMPPDMEVFFRQFMVSVFEARNYKPTNRNDFVDFILNFKQKNYIEGDSITNMKTGADKKVSMPVTEDFLVANCVAFFIAGYETSATTMSYTMYELAKSPENLKRVQKEIDEYLVKTGNKLEYDCLTELPFTEACVSEAMRLYPVLGIITREVVEDYTLPTGVHLDKGVRIHLPVYHLHHNPEYFPEPEVYRPQRFLGEEKRKIESNTYMPFGDGPRICIGMRFAKMQVFAGLVTVLKKYNLELTPETPRKLEFLATSLITQPTEPLRIKFTVREGWENRTFVKTQ
ncbi:cytochrome P450 6B5-like [Ostrinia furnacalis]|uniref:unspecific monooxygenase n=1 Tax=Ostrinia furnacalis TaxID=93504 RepID=A0A7S9CED9_OSTFU|nr:cytochrome P450 6B5-like [Ostrinia furnacalis]QPF77608.1 cytochrome P450 monooxygenase CYP6AE135 [Ostrinia furnacalis]